MVKADVHKKVGVVRLEVVPEIKAFLGFILKMGLHTLPDIKDYFALRWAVKTPCLWAVFTQVKFIMLFEDFTSVMSREINEMRKSELF